MLNVTPTREDGTEVGAGDEILDFRGTSWKYLGVTDRARIYVQDVEDPSNKREFFPTVFKLTLPDD